MTRTVWNTLKWCINKIKLGNSWSKERTTNHKSCKQSPGFCPRWAVQGAGARHWAVPPGTHGQADPSARHSKSVKYAIRKPHIFIFSEFFLFKQYYLFYFISTTHVMRVILVTGDLVKYVTSPKPDITTGTPKQTVSYRTVWSVVLEIVLQPNLHTWFELTE